MKTKDKVLITSNKTYDRAKYVAQIVLPAVAALYFALSRIWGFPHGEEVLGSIAAVEVCLGALLGASASAYKQSDDRYDGAIVVQDSDVATNFSIELEGDPYELADKNELLFRVKT
jgi:hypothetical protein